MNELAGVLHYYGLIKDNPSDKFKIMCPFHPDKNPSMIVDLLKGNFYCFGCGKTGDVNKFVQWVEKVDPLQSMLMVKKIVKTNAVKKLNIDFKPRNDAKEDRKLAEEYFTTLSKPSWRYIKKHYMFDRGFTRRTLIEHDIRINQNTTYPVIAPIYDMGRFKGYVCRSDKDIDRKYLYNTGFSRKSTIVGDYEGPWVVVTEGYMDWLKLKQFDVENAAAILGWRITDEQIKKLSRYTKTVISALDNTETGREGTKILSKHFKVVRFQFTENAKDVGDLDLFDFNLCWSNTVDKIRQMKGGSKK